MSRIEVEHPGMVSLAAHSRVVRDLGREVQRHRIRAELWRAAAIGAFACVIICIVLWSAA